MEKADFKSFTARSIKLGHFHSSFITVCRDDTKISHFNSETIFGLQKAVITTLLCLKSETEGVVPVMAYITQPLKSWGTDPFALAAMCNLVAAIFSNCL